MGPSTIAVNGGRSRHLRGQPRRVFDDCPACGVIVPRMHQQPLKGGGVDSVIQYLGDLRKDLREEFPGSGPAASASRRQSQ